MANRNASASISRNLELDWFTSLRPVTPIVLQRFLISDQLPYEPGMSTPTKSGEILHLSDALAVKARGNEVEPIVRVLDPGSLSTFPFQGEGKMEISFLGS